MVFVNGLEENPAFYSRNKLGRSGLYSFRRYSHCRFGNRSRYDGVYQVRHSADTQRIVKMRYYRPTNPQTVPQQANRAKFAAAMSAWVALTPTEKASYTERAKRRGMFGWGLFIREYYQQS